MDRSTPNNKCRTSPAQKSGNVQHSFRFLTHGSRPHSSNIPPGRRSVSNQHSPAGRCRWGNPTLISAPWSHSAHPRPRCSQWKFYSHPGAAVPRSRYPCYPLLLRKGNYWVKQNKQQPPGRHSYRLGTAAESGGQGLTGCVCWFFCSPLAGLWKIRTQPQQLLPVSAAGCGRRRCCSSSLPHQEKPVHIVYWFFLVRVVIQHSLKTIVVQFVFEVIG